MLEGLRHQGIKGWRAGRLKGWRDGGKESWRDRGIKGSKDGGIVGRIMNPDIYIVSLVSLYTGVGFINTWLTHADEAGGVHSKLPIAPYSVQCTLYSAQRTVYSVQCTVQCSIQCTGSPPPISISVCKGPAPNSWCGECKPGWQNWPYSSRLPAAWLWHKRHPIFW